MNSNQRADILISLYDKWNLLDQAIKMADIQVHKEGLIDEIYELEALIKEIENEHVKANS